MTAFVLRCATLGVVLASVPLLPGELPENPTLPPVPAPIMTARKVFISNAGVDNTSLTVFKRKGSVNQPYNSFYAAMKAWGRFEIVSAPADADLILEIRFTSPLTDCGNVPTYQPQLQLTILDARTHFILWTAGEPVDGALRKVSFEKNFNEGLANLMANLRDLVPQPAPARQNVGN